MRIVIAAASLLVASCAPTHRSAAGRVARDPAPPGRLVDVGGYRLHIHCTGRGAPAVVLLAGSGDFSFDWSLVQPGLARSTRVCSYDRAGSAWSDPGPTPRTMRQEAHELRLLLQRAGVAPPYLLVGHSYGGLLARAYAGAHPAEVAGVVLVDPTHEDTRLMIQGRLTRVREGAGSRPVPRVQTMASSPPRPPGEEELAQERMNREAFGPPAISPPYDRLPREAQALRLWALGRPPRAAAADDFWAEELREMHDARRADPHPLGAMPLVVLAAGRAEPAPQGVTEEAWRELTQEKRAQRADLATLSTEGRLVVDTASGHHVHLDDPARVIEAVTGLLSRLRIPNPAESRKRTRQFPLHTVAGTHRSRRAPRGEGTKTSPARRAPSPGRMLAIPRRPR
jgi:pimeloyl-ACP methyl ester carboxylesterase